MKPMNVREIGKRLRRYLNSPASMLGMDRATGATCSWTEGYCLPLALGIKAWLTTALGVKSRLVGVKKYNGIHHVLVAFKADGHDIYADGDGLSTRFQLLKRWDREFPSAPATLVPLTRRQVLDLERRWFSDGEPTGLGRRGGRDASRRLRRMNPDDIAFLRGLQILREDDPQWSWGKKGKFTTFIAVTSNDEEAGRLDLRVKRKTATPRSLYVMPKYLRRGIASLLYRVAEESLGVEVRHSGNLTEDGRAFKRGRRR